MTAGAGHVELDHLVVACASLDAGRAWCEGTLGVAPSAGGKHPRMGTHNLLVSVASTRFARSYLELIAIDPEAPAPATPRWFELDRAELRARLAEGPKLVQWVARTNDIEAAAATLRDAGFEPGPIVDAERMTTRGLLRWRIAIPSSGARHAGGAVPLLIEWGDVHPTDDMPPSDVTLETLTVAGPGAARVAPSGASVSSDANADPLVADLATPRGPIRLTCA